MENKLKVGDRIRVFEVTDKGSELYCNEKLKVIQRPCLDYNDFNESGVDLLTKDLNNSFDYHFGIDLNRSHAKHVCTMVVTKLK